MKEESVDKWATISFLLVFFPVVVYFGYLMHYALIKTPWDFVVKIGLPMGILPLVGYFFTSEIIECRKFGRSRELCLKRFAGRVFLDLGFVLLLLLFLILAIMTRVWGALDNAHFSVMALIFLGWGGLVLLIMIKFKESVRKLTDGLW